MFGNQPPRRFKVATRDALVANHPLAQPAILGVVRRQNRKSVAGPFSNLLAADFACPNSLGQLTVTDWVSILQYQVVPIQPAPMRQHLHFSVEFSEHLSDRASARASTEYPKAL
jgi:hypothetical protein